MTTGAMRILPALGALALLAAVHGCDDGGARIDS